MKKNYAKPSFDVVELSSETVLTTISLGVGEGETQEQEINGRRDNRRWYE